MIRVVVEVDAPTGQAIGVKESLAMWLEHYGDARVVAVEEIRPQQMKMEVRT